MPSVNFSLQHWGWQTLEGGEIGILYFRNSAEPFNMLTLDSYREGVEFFRALAGADPGDEASRTLKVIVITGEAVQTGDGLRRAFCAGGSPHSIVKPLVERGDVAEQIRFTRMTVDLIRNMILCPQVIIAAVDGQCMGAGAAVATAAMLRVGTPRSKVGFLFNQMGLSAADMGAVFFLQRIIGAGRAAKYLLLGRDHLIQGAEGEAIGYFNQMADPADLIDASVRLARQVIARNSPRGLYASKLAFYEELGDWRRALRFEEAVQAAMMTDGPEMRIGLEAFLANPKTPTPDYSSAPNRTLRIARL